MERDVGRLKTSERCCCPYVRLDRAQLDGCIRADGRHAISAVADRPTRQIRDGVGVGGEVERAAGVALAGWLAVRTQKVLVRLEVAARLCARGRVAERSFKSLQYVCALCINILALPIGGLSSRVVCLF